MNRSSFVLSALGAAVGAGLPATSFAQFMLEKASTQQALFMGLPRPKPGQWVRFIMGSGVEYQKQIGLGAEPSTGGELYYVETQIGTPGGSCNPNTMKRVYLTKPHFDSLLSQDAVLANVANSGTMLTRWGDVGGGQTQTANDARLRILDAGYLYDDRPLRLISRTQERFEVPAGNAYGGSENSPRGKLSATQVTHIVGEFSPPYDAKHRLTHVEVWTTPEVPFGVAKYRALAKDQDPFEMHVFAYGAGFKPDLNMSLATVRAITPDGTHVQTS